jgi:DNA ligase-1
MLCEECYHSVGVLAERLSLLLPDGAGGEEISLDHWMRERLLPLPALDDEQKFARLRRGVDELPADHRFTFFRRIDT